MPRQKTRPANAQLVRLELTPEENELVAQAAVATGERYRSVFARRVVVEVARAAMGQRKGLAPAAAALPTPKEPASKKRKGKRS